MAALLPRRRAAWSAVALGLSALVLAAACTSSDDSESGAAPTSTALPPDVVEAPPTPTPTATPTATPTPTPAPVLSATGVEGSALVDLRLDQPVPWTTTGVTVDGVLRAVSPTGQDAEVAATVWVPATTSEVCVGAVDAGARPVFWDAGTEPTPAPLTGPTPSPEPDDASPDAPATPTTPPTPTPLPTPTPEPTPTPSPPEPRFCTQVTGGVDVPPALFPGHRVVAHYGTAITPALGVLGEGPPDVALERLLEAAATYEDFELPVVPAFEFIVTVAQGSPGADGLFTLARPAEEVRPYLEGVRRAGGVVVLDLQPGRASFLDQAEQFVELLREPDVHLALDPEWSMDPGQVPGRVIGDTDGPTVNAVAAWLQDLVVRHGLPQKTLIVHQFTAGMVDDRDLIVDPEGIAVMFHIDGQGPVASKYGTYDQLAVRAPFFTGFKVFFDEDSRVMEPGEVMAIDPQPVYVSYQ